MVVDPLLKRPALTSDVVRVSTLNLRVRSTRYSRWPTLPVVVASSARFAEQTGKRGDGFEQHGVEASLLIGGAVRSRVGTQSALV